MRVMATMPKARGIRLLGRLGRRSWLTGRMIASPFDGWSVEDDLSPAGWFADALKPLDPEAFRVWSVVPDRYSSYARLFQPAYTWDEATTQPVQIREMDHPGQQGWEGDPRFTWQTGWPESQLPRYETPTIGTLDIADLRTLTELLQSFTRTPDNVWALIWPGWGFGWSNECMTVLRRSPYG